MIHILGSRLTCDRLGDNRGMMVRMVASIEIVMVQRSVQPVVNKLDWTSVKQNYENYAIRSPNR